MQNLRPGGGQCCSLAHRNMPFLHKIDNLLGLTEGLVCFTFHQSISGCKSRDNSFVYAVIVLTDKCIALFFFNLRVVSTIIKHNIKPFVHCANSCIEIIISKVLIRIFVKRFILIKLILNKRWTGGMNSMTHYPDKSYTYT